VMAFGFEEIQEGSAYFVRCHTRKN
jgi:hypothetical protein